MIATLVAMMIIMAGVGVTAYLTASSMQSTHFKQAIEDNNEIGMEAKELLIMDIHRINNSSEFYAPVGDNSIESYTALPAFLGSKRHTLSGVALQYCPTSGSASTSISKKVVNKDGSEYSISTINNPAKAGYDYVNGSDLKLNNVIAFIVSPLGSNTDMPSCSQITYNSQHGQYIAPKGQVFAVTEMDMLSNEVNRSIVEARVNPAITNNPALETGEELTSKSLTTNIESFKNSTTQEMIVYLESGVYNVPAGTMNSSNVDGKKLTLVGNGSATINASSIDMEGIDFRVKNVGINSDIAINNSKVNLEDSSIGSIVLKNGELSIVDSKVNGSIEAKGSDLRAINGTVDGSTVLKGSTLRIADTFDFGQVQALHGSTVNIVDANGEIDNTTRGIGILGSTVSIDSSTVNIGGATAIQNQGELVIWNSDIRSKGSSYGILSDNGGVNRIFESEIFTKGNGSFNPFFDDNGTALVSGYNSSFGGSCSGEIFEAIATIKDMNGVDQPVPNPNNQASWNCI